MTKRMLIDDTQPEETRVVVMDGAKIEDVEFESSFRRQIKGNIYLAKVMRIEPSLQAAFVDYGGNRHGFLAFGEIHPDYYNVSDEVLHACEQEADEIIENKKQIAKEREIERTRRAEARAARRAKYLAEMEALKQEEDKKQEAAADENKEEQAPLNDDTSSSQDELAIEVVLPDATNAPAHPRRGRRAKKALTEDNAEAKENKEAPVSEEENDEAKTQEQAPRRGRRRKAPKTLSDSEGIEAGDTISDNDKISDEIPEKEEVSRGNANDDDIALDDEDEADEDWEAQKKLLTMRKLFHCSHIQEVIREGQLMLVQVVKEERGNKGAALTTYLSLAGRYCVLMPNRIKSGGVSRKITNAQDRKRLKNIIGELPMAQEMSIIVRTAGEEKTKADIIRDYNYLIRTWNQIRIDSLKLKAPALIYEEGNLIKRALRDMFTKEISEIIVDGESAFKSARSFMKILSPHNMKKLKSCKPGEAPLFQRFQVESQLDKLHNPNVSLASGGYLVINPTEALVSIDVNSGRATKESDLEETALKTNLEAADEIARQLKMRNLAGLIVIDFIDMEDPHNNLAIEKRMKEAMKNDRARVQISKMSCFGLLEISRQRLHSSFLESNYLVCPHCHGRGIIRTLSSGAMSILRVLEEEGMRGRSSVVNIYIPQDYVAYLLNQKRQALSEIEKRYNMSIIISADPAIKNISDYRLERTKNTNSGDEDKTTVIRSYEEEERENTKQTEQDFAKSEEENTSPAEQEEHHYRRKGRRNRFERRRGRRDFEEKKPQEIKEEPQNEPLEEQPKKKVSWWKRLING